MSGIIQYVLVWFWLFSLRIFLRFIHVAVPTPAFLPGESQDGGAWWAAVYGVAQSRTRLQQVGCHFLPQFMKVKSESEVTQSCPTLSDPMDCSPPGSSIHGILQARILVWGAIAFSGIVFYCMACHVLTLHQHGCLSCFPLFGYYE